MVGEGEGDHGFDHWDSAGEDAGVVTALAFEGRVFVVGGDSVLLWEDCRDGFEGNAEGDGHAVGDAPLDASGVVGGGVNGLVVVAAIGIVMLRTPEKSSGIAGADFKPFGCREGEEGFGEIGFEFVENGFPPTGWDSAGDSTDDSADGIALLADGFDVGDHLLGGGLIRASNNVGFYLGEGEGFGVDGGFDVLDLINPSEDFDIEMELEKLFSNGSGGDAADGFACRSSAPTGDRSQSVLGVVSEIGMRWAEFVAEFVVVAGALILIPDEEGDGGSGGETGLDAREDFDLVGFLALSDDFGLSRAAAVEFKLDFFGGDGKF